MRKIRDWIWDRLFLDFYLDKRWTLRFKIMNLLSGDMLRILISEFTYQTKSAEQFADESPSMSWHVKRAQYWLKQFENEVMRNA